MKILLTAPPGVGKSTVISRVVTDFLGAKNGIVAREILDAQGVRTGFTAINQAGESRQFMFATINPTSESIGGLFDVDVAAIDNFVVAELREALGTLRTNASAKANLTQTISGMSLLYIDEIGRAQARSAAFLQILRKVMHSDCNVLGSIVFDDEPWSLEFKHDKNVCLIEVTEENRDQLPALLLSAFNHQLEYNALNSAQQRLVNMTMLQLVQDRKIISARKLFDNALGYVVGNKIKPVDSNNFLVEGLTLDHKITRKESGNFSCDCDLSNGKGMFNGAPAVCSHEMSIRILALGQ